MATTADLHMTYCIQIAKVQNWLQTQVLNLVEIVSLKYYISELEDALGQWPITSYH